ncbi:hypothetical protein HK102_005928 [Quaeritorhiza haematococci]|nr:hypothetical protein HK102_005928 [Quaeritorhiza haematococci]
MSGLQETHKGGEVETEEQVRVEYKKELRRKNVEAYTKRPDASAFKNLDGSIKKNTSFIKKLRTSLTHEQLSSLTKELLSLKLEKYLSEVVSAIAEAKFKNGADIWAAVEICSLLHQRFADFSGPLISLLLKHLAPPPSTAGMSAEQKEREESSRLSKQRSTLRFLSELYLVGVARDPANVKDKNQNLIPRVLLDLFQSDRENLANLPLAVTFIKYLGEDFLGIVPKRPRDRSSSLGSINEPVAPATKVESALESTSQQPAYKESPFVGSEVQTAVREIFHNYFKVVSSFVLRMHKRIRKQEKNNHEFFIARGEITEDRQERYEKELKAYEKFLNSAQTLAEYLQLELPELPEEEGTTRLGIGITESGKEKEEKDFTGGIWEDEAAKAFYENLLDLKTQVPPIFLGEKKGKQDEAKDEQKDEAKDDDQTEAGKDGDENDDEPQKKDDTADNEDAANDKDDEESLNPNADDDDDDDGDKQKKVGSTAQAVLDSLLLTRLPNALNRDAVDQIAVEYCYVNSKGSRKRLVRTLLAVSRQRLDLLPYYSRLIATLNVYMPEIGTAVVDALEREFHGHQKRKDQVFIEEKIKNIRFLAELTKFRVTPLHVIFHCLKVLLDDFSHHNIEVACNLLETCGRFLYKNPETSVRCSNMLEKMVRKSKVQHLDNRQSLMIENAYYQCNPPDRSARLEKNRPPIEMYIRKLIYSDLAKKTAEKILKQLRKMNWEDPDAKKALTKVFFKIWKVKYSNLHLLAFMTSELSRYYPHFGVAVVDNCLEEIRVHLELNLFKHNQRRVATVKFLGELYNYRMVEAAVIFETLYLLLQFGHEGGIPRRGVVCPFDAPHDFFRVRLCCTLLETCGQCFDRGSTGKKLNHFLTFFQVCSVKGAFECRITICAFISDSSLRLANPFLCQMYIYTKIRPPMDVEFLIMDTFELLRPDMPLFGSYEEALEEVNKIAVEHMKAQGGANGVVRDDEDDEDDEDEDDEEGTRKKKGEDDEGSDSDEDDEDEGARRKASAGRDDSGEEDGGEEDDEEETLVVHMPENDPEISKEADEEFEREFSRMMQESLESRKYERKPVAFDVAIPVRNKAGAEQGPSGDVGNGQVAFTLLTKKGNKQMTKTMALPADSSFVISTRTKQEAEHEEKMQLKQLVLSYEEREREGIRRDMSGTSRPGQRSPEHIIKKSNHKTRKVLWSGGSGGGGAYYDRRKT